MGRKKQADAPWYILISFAVLGENIGSSTLDVPDDLEESVCDALGLLSDREADILMKRYVDMSTLSECGEEFCISRERVRAIEARALRKLRSKPTVYLFTQGKERYLQSVYEAEEIRELNIKQKINKYGKCNLDILFLSVRSRNALQRGGIWTIGELLGLIINKDDEILKIPGLGFKSANEIIEKLGVNLG